MNESLNEFTNKSQEGMKLQQIIQQNRSQKGKLRHQRDQMQIHQEVHLSYLQYQLQYQSLLHPFKYKILNSIFSTIIILFNPYLI